MNWIITEHIVPPGEAKQKKTDAEESITRLITRSFYAQSLANAQADVHHQNKRQQKKVVKPPKPKEVIVISPDTAVEVKKKSKETMQGSSWKNKVQTLSSDITARSKFACEVADKIVGPK